MACSSTHNADFQAHLTALEHFTYKQDIGNEWLAYTSINQQFTGDCEDYAFTLQRKIGGDVYQVNTNIGSHAVLIKGGLIYDNLHKWPIPLTQYQGLIIHELDFKDQGRLFDNSHRQGLNTQQLKLQQETQQIGPRNLGSVDLSRLFLQQFVGSLYKAEPG